MKIDLERWGETLLGAAVVIVAFGFFAYAAAHSGGAPSGSGAHQYTARFQRVDGIEVGSDVRVSGVKVGVVSAVELDPETYLAKLTLNVARTVEVLNESSAKVASDGLLGGAHIAIEQAGFEPMAPGSEILNTQGSVDLLTLLSSAASQLGGSSENEDATNEAAP